MHDGDTFRLTAPTLAVTTSGRRVTVLMVPEDSLVTILDFDGSMVNLDYDGKTVSMFVVDLHERGELVYTDLKAG